MSTEETESKEKEQEKRDRRTPAAAAAADDATTCRLACFDAVSRVLSQPFRQSLVQTLTGSHSLSADCLRSAPVAGARASRPSVRLSRQHNSTSGGSSSCSRASTLGQSSADLTSLARSPPSPSVSLSVSLSLSFSFSIRIQHWKSSVKSGGRENDYA